MSREERDFDTAWHAVPEPVRGALALAYEALAAGGLAVGAVLTDAGGRTLAASRNEAYEEGPGTGPLRGTPLAHAEMNALGAASPQDWLRPHGARLAELAAAREPRTR
ncbi:hypothetical protein OG389_13585 [Streptomyces sp. NBC_00435]|uniref:hypothetical protein n=1 Tax=Streptomyces sp. NBC_00435 TaxID=2903649 RepID=UPI002E1DE9AE